MKKQATIGALVTLLGCATGDLGEFPTALSEEARTVFPDVRGTWETSFVLFGGTAVRIVVEITEQRLPTLESGGPARFYGSWRMMSTNDATVTWIVPYVPTSDTDAFPISGVLVEMPQIPGADDSADHSPMAMILGGPCDGSTGASRLGAMGEFYGRVGSPLNPFTLDPKLLLGDVELPIFDPRCERADLYQLGMAFTPAM